MSGKRNFYDRAAVATFFKTIKVDLIWRRSRYARRDIEVTHFECINGFYNQRRSDTASGGKSPVDFEGTVAEQEQLGWHKYPTDPKTLQTGHTLRR